MVGALLHTQGQAYDSKYLLNILLDNNFRIYENLGPNTLILAPHATKDSATHDPDTPRLHETMHSDNCDKFLSAMGEESAVLEVHGTWTEVRKATMPQGTG
jgi:hypothetical protein